MVRCNFDLGDFPHKGRSFLIHPQNETRRSPDKIAREIIAEVASHRNTCNRCGIAVPTLPRRAAAAATIADHHRQHGTLNDPHLYARNQPLTRPDEPEKLVFSRHAQRLNQAIDYLEQNLSPQDLLSLNPST